MNLPSELLAAASRSADALFADLAHARAVVIATEDGMEVVSVIRNELDAARFSAITSSMSAIGEVVSSETGLGSVRCVMVEADGGYLVMRGCRSGGIGLVVAALVGRDALLGLAIHRVGQAAREFSA
ncbi:roadblock/LC7 domain-containing protein [Aquabacterium sp. OR-4]|uniref:roadblock/LC7 domain-containing protein n=1 Tax=Aquabacterium sp. OR-4 TaxID=2978127 RepID=UPI0021B23192|nr:roadblock/LC7 domain-containing protein [Aquabacterium sp. OR-4]MDT7836022.1 hypothetical protein [Aquabacterium sp. OR-4]